MRWRGSAPLSPSTWETEIPVSPLVPRTARMLQGPAVLRRALSHGCDWPETRRVVDDLFRDVPAAERRRMCAENAAELYRLV